MGNHAVGCSFSPTSLGLENFLLLAVRAAGPSCQGKKEVVSLRPLVCWAICRILDHNGVCVWSRGPVGLVRMPWLSLSAFLGGGTVEQL